METNIIRQPMMNKEKEVCGYELLYQEKDGTGLYNQADTDAANAIETFLSEFSNDKFIEGKVAFITFTPTLLLRNIHAFFPPDQLVIQIEDNSIVHPKAQEAIYNIRKEGYKIALKNFQFSARYFGLLDVVDYIKIDMSRLTESDRNAAKIGAGFQKKVIAFNVNSKEAYDLAQELEYDYMQGTAVAEAMFTAVRRVEHLQSNFFQLMAAITKSEPDMDDIAQIIERDVTLAFPLLKLVNSAYFGLRNHVSSVKQALLVLGLSQLKQWIYLLSFKNSHGDISSEMIKMSFLYAKFCSELSVFIEDLGISQADAYLLGMFSTLPILVGMPIEEAVAELPILEEIKLALVENEGPLAPLLSLVTSYDKADWKAVAQYAEQLHIPENIVSQKYFECIEYVNGIWEGLMSIKD